jgi:hypothetical protein
MTAKHGHSAQEAPAPEPEPVVEVPAVAVEVNPLDMIQLQSNCDDNEPEFYYTDNTEAVKTLAAGLWARSENEGDEYNGKWWKDVEAIAKELGIVMNKVEVQGNFEVFNVEGDC